MNTTGSNIPIYVLVVSQILVHFALRRAVFELQAILMQVHQMTKMTLNTTRSEVHYICVVSIPESQLNFARFPLRPAVFEMKGCQNYKYTK